LQRTKPVARCYKYTVYHGLVIQPGVPFRVYDIHLYITVLYSYLRYSSVTILYPSIPIPKFHRLSPQAKPSQAVLPERSGLSQELLIAIPAPRWALLPPEAVN
jgi:hypothetical protein